MLVYELGKVLCLVFFKLLIGLWIISFVFIFIYLMVIFYVIMVVILYVYNGIFCNSLKMNEVFF